MVIGHQKGATPRKCCATGACPAPKGYRKALRLMKMADKFGPPIFTFVDTPGAYPGVGAEERGQSEAIGRNFVRDGRSSHRSSLPSLAKVAAWRRAGGRRR